MKNSCFIVLFLLGIIPSAFAQLIGFEEEVPEAFTVSGKGEEIFTSPFPETVNASGTSSSNPMS